MTIRSGFFKSVGGDRKYLAEFFTSYFGSFIGNGVFPNPSTNLQVVAGTNMTVNVRPGKGWINGYYLENDSDFSLTHIPANGTFNRIDRIVFAVNFDTRDMTIYIKQGANGATASPPPLIRNSTVYELCLADVSIPAGTTTITQSLINDTRQNNELCGIVHGTVDQVDTTTLYNQYQTYLNEFQQSGTQQFQSFLTASQQEFDVFFQALEENLSGDVAGNLQNQITQLQNNTRIATTAQAQAGTDNTTIMTPLRVKEADLSRQITPSDLNDVIEHGNYLMSNSTVSALQNKPAESISTYTYLTVISGYANNVPFQFFYQPRSGKMWIRGRDGTLTTSIWSDWKRVDNEFASTAQAQAGTDNTTIMTPLKVSQSFNQYGLGTSTSELINTGSYDDFTKGGFYNLSGTVLNSPSGQNSHLLVLPRSSSITSQIAIAPSTQDVFVRSKVSNVWSNWRQITENLSNLQTTSKNSLVSAINEVKQQANDIKTRWANVVGAPLLASDTQAQLESKTQSLKNTLATNLSNKGVDSNGSETLSSLVNKVSEVATGTIISQASGSIVSSTDELDFNTSTGGGTTSYRYVTIDAYLFRPNYVTISYTNGSEIIHTTYDSRISPNYCVVSRYTPGTSTANAQFVSLTGNAYINDNGGLRLPVWIGRQETFQWTAQTL